MEEANQNMIKKENLTQNIFRILGTIALVFYLFFLIGEGIPLTNQMSFAETSVYLLFALFVVGYYFLWKNELISGLVIITWYALEWILVFWVWIDGALTLILGLPIALLGLILLIYGIRKRTKPSES